ncbi:hypothetical protein Tco_1344923 [Tanacetum coccineum]
MDAHIHHEVPSQQTPTLLIVPVSVITESSLIFTTVIPKSLPYFTPPPAQSTPPTTKATNPLSTLLDFASDDPLKTQVTALVDEHLDARITEQVKNQLPQILPKEVSNFAPLVIQSMVTESLEHAVLAKESSQPKSTYEAASLLIEFELKKILIYKMDKSELYLVAPEHRECYKGLIQSYDLDKTLFSTYDKKRKTSKDAEPAKGPKTKESQSSSSKGTKSQPKSYGKSVQSEEPKLSTIPDIHKDQERNLGNDDDEPMKETVSKRDWFPKPIQPQEPTDPDWNVSKTPQQGQTQSWLITLASSVVKPSKTFDELMSTPIDISAYIMNGLKITNLTQETWGDYPFDLTKPLPLVMSGNCQKVPVDYFFNNDLKYLQGGVSTMTYTTSITKTKDAQYDLQGIEDMVPNIWSLVKVAYDNYALWGISHWIQQCKTFYAYARGLESRHDVYSMKRILTVTQVEVMRKHGYGYLKEIIVRKVDNDLYRFKEGDFPHLCINDIEDMLLLLVQNRLTNLSGNDVFKFEIALRMFTRSLVIQKRVEDPQLGVKCYQKKINVTKPETTKLGVRKRDSYTPYQDPQGFIYVDNNGRNRLMRSDELYKFSDMTLTGLRTLLDDITKNIRMEYLPQRRWITLENKRANIMIKAIDKQLK